MAVLFPQERRQEIARLIQAEPRVAVSDLSRRFAVSEVTIRKDLAHLHETGQIQRTHGGAIRLDVSLEEGEFDERTQLRQNEKGRIADTAASLVRDGDSIALDASTTALYVARRVRDRRAMTVVTNSLRIAIELGSRPGTSVLIPGGVFRPESFSLVGTWGETVLRQVNIQRAFVGARGFTLTEGLTDVNSEEVKLKQAIIEAAKEVIAVIDHTKWGDVALATFCPPERIKMIITDDKAPPAMVEEARARGIEVRIV